VTEISQMAEASRAPSIVRRPRDAATLVIVDRTDAAPRVLMGRRRPDQVFLPDTFVFPGGRVEPVDRALARNYALAPSASAHVKLAMRGRPSDTRASALALAAIRETYEETGVIVGEAHPHGGATDQGAWTAFLAQGYRPRLDSLAFFARAITPPGRPRRYDTRFFIVDATHIVHRAPGVDGELLDIGWFTPEQAKGLKLPSITRHVLDDLSAWLNSPREDVTPRPVPFYFHRRGRFERTLLTCALSTA
jgi:8-oxo-dGTP pyrophosphatase MutT (NUDIX family)